LLVELKVNSLGIIDELTWVPGSGFNVITGETGAGKSLVIDALNSLIDGRMEEGSIRHGSDLARMEGVFCFPSEGLKTLAQLLSDKGVELDDDSLVMSGEFRRRGRAVFRLNGSAVPRAALREAGRLLVNIHSQTEHLALFERQNHLDYLDAYGRTVEVRQQFASLFGELSRLQTELSALDQAQRDRAHREEILAYQVDEIKRAAPRDGEEQELTQERQVMASGEKLKALS
jgi:DNA repair protein RecN (Recombination protein N)